MEYEPERTTAKDQTLQVETRHQDLSASIDFPEYILVWYLAVLENEFACVATYYNRHKKVWVAGGSNIIHTSHTEFVQLLMRGKACEPFFDDECCDAF